MSAIVWLTCPACGYRFYIVAGDAGKNHMWFCPRCQADVPESDGLEAEERHPGQASRDGHAG